jgi:hypothetical protein
VFAEATTEDRISNRDSTMIFGIVIERGGDFNSERTLLFGLQEFLLQYNNKNPLQVLKTIWSLKKTLSISCFFLFYELS